AVANDAAELLLRPGKKARDVFKCDQWNVERITETHEARTFHRGVYIEDTGQKCGLIGDDTDGKAVHARKADHQVSCKVFVNLEEIGFVYNGVNGVLDVVGF